MFKEGGGGREKRIKGGKERHQGGKENLLLKKRPNNRGKKGKHRVCVTKGRRRWNWPDSKLKLRKTEPVQLRGKSKRKKKALG